MEVVADEALMDKIRAEMKAEIEAKVRSDISAEAVAAVRSEAQANARQQLEVRFLFLSQPSQTDSLYYNQDLLMNITNSTLVYMRCNQNAGRHGGERADRGAKEGPEGGLEAPPGRHGAAVGGRRG